MCNEDQEIKPTRNHSTPHECSSVGMIELCLASNTKLREAMKTTFVINNENVIRNGRNNN